MRLFELIAGLRLCLRKKCRRLGKGFLGLYLCIGKILANLEIKNLFGKLVFLGVGFRCRVLLVLLGVILCLFCIGRYFGRFRVFFFCFSWFGVALPFIFWEFLVGLVVLIVEVIFLLRGLFGGFVGFWVFLVRFNLFRDLLVVNLVVGYLVGFLFILLALSFIGFHFGLLGFIIGFLGFIVNRFNLNFLNFLRYFNFIRLLLLLVDLLLILNSCLIRYFIN